MTLFKTLRSVVRFQRIRDRSGRAEAGGSRLGRGLAPCLPSPAPKGRASSTTSTAEPRTSSRWTQRGGLRGRRCSARGCCATSEEVEYLDRYSADDPLSPRAGAHGLHPNRRSPRRARRRPRGGPRRPAVHAVDLGTRSIEEVAAGSDGRKWFQVYVWRDRGLVKEMLERAAAAGYQAIVVTVDTPVLGRRERDIRRGFSLPPRSGCVRSRRRRHPGMDVGLRPVRSDLFRQRGRARRGDGAAVALADYINSQFDPGCRGRTSTGCARCGRPYHPEGHPDGRRRRARG